MGIDSVGGTRDLVLVQNTRGVRMGEEIRNTRVHCDTYADKVNQGNLQETRSGRSIAQGVR